jgi:mRNA-degrading endonuclease RelE of RelBE toxin-antitoxin system
MTETSMTTVAIADSFFEAFERVPRKVQRKVREFLTRFRENPRAASIHYEPIQAIDPHVRTVRIGDDYRGIVLHPDAGEVFILVWVDHHDEAMDWAKRKRFDIHPRTGALQCLTLDDQGAVAVPAPQVGATPAPKQAKPLFAAYTSDQLFDLGVPKELLQVVADIRSEADLDRCTKGFPAEATEALYGLASGMSYETVKSEINHAAVKAQSFAEAIHHPDTLRRFVIVDSDAALQSMLDAPMAKWRVFLHPTQRKLVDRDYSGPCKVTGGAGTGKTVVAMHRAVHLAKTIFTAAQDRILFTTFTRNLAEAIDANLKELDNSVQSKIVVRHIHGIAHEVIKQAGLRFEPIDDEDALESWREAIKETGGQLTYTDPEFYAAEFQEVVLAQGITDLATYLVAKRIGRKGQLPRTAREPVWQVMERFQSQCDAAGRMTFPMMVAKAASYLEHHDMPSAYRAVVIDESQDMTAADWRLIRRLAPVGPNDLFLVGDAHQRIYGRPVVLSRCGIQVSGRSKRLRINYRTTEEIRRWACGLLDGLAFDDLDGQPERQDGYTSLMHGDPPTVTKVASWSAAKEPLIKHLKSLFANNIEPQSICIVVPTNHRRSSIAKVLDAAQIPAFELEKTLPGDSQPGIRVGTYQRVKGLEFRQVIMMCEDPVEAELFEQRERSLLFVASTRARDGLFVCRVCK